MKKFLQTKILAMILASAVAVTSIGAGGYIIYDYESLPEQIEEARVVETAAPVEEEVPEESEPEEEPEIEEEEEEPEETTKELSMVGTSMEKDLKIKIQDQSSKLVTGVPFSISVKSTKTGAKASSYEDKDKDGIIYIDKIDAGDYAVELQDVEGYLIKTRSITVKVKDKIEYKKVDVTAEIKTESQVNTAVEDTAVNNVPVEETIKDTVPLLESKVSTSSVAKKDVDTSNFTKAAVNSAKNSITLKKNVVQAPAQPTKPAEPEKPTTPTEPVEPEEPEKPAEPEQPEEPEKPAEPEQPTEPEKPAEPEEPTTPAEPEQPAEPSSPDDSTEPKTSTETEQPVPGNAEPSAEPVSVAAYYSPNRIVSRTLRGTAILSAAPVAATSTETTVTVSLPKDVTLYDCDNSASNSVALAVEMTGDSSIIKEIRWQCTDSSVVSLSSKSGNSVTVTKKGKGSANIFAKVTYVTDGNGTTATESVKCTVFVEELSDKSVVLKDKEGNTLYVDSNAQTPATLKDYDSQDTFYTSPKYTGWQTIDGKVYYYDEDHNALTGNQVIGGVMYTFSESGNLSQSSGNRGIDVSKYQGNIDWGAVAASGINFAIIRVGYRGSSTGVLVEDPYFRRNIAGATKAGVKVGVYFFTQAVTEAEAVEEASMAMSLVSGYKLSYPIFIDTESASNGRANGLSKSARTAVVKAFCQTVQNGGYKAGVYASKSWYNNQLNASSLSSYCIWVAQYNSSCTYSGKYDMWQYSSKGKVSGISGNVDMNLSYTGY